MTSLWCKLRHSLLISFLIWYQTGSIARAVDSIQVGIHQNEPKVFLDQKEKPAGFFVDLLRHIAQEEGWTIEFVHCQWDDCLLALEQEELHIMVDVAYSQEHERRFDFNREIVLTSWSVVYTRKGIELNSILDLHQKKVAVLKNSTQYNALANLTKQFNVHPQFLEVEDFDTMFELIEGKIVDAGVVNRFFGQRVEQQYDVVPTNILIEPSQLHFAVPEGKNADLIAAIDRQLATMKTDPSSVYHQSFQRWLGDFSEEKTDWSMIKRIVGVCIIVASLIIIVIVLIWNRKLTKEIAERKQAEAALRESEERYRSIFDQIVVGIVNGGLTGELLDCNHRFCQMLGYQPEEFSPGTIKEITYPEERELHVPYWHPLIAGEIPYFSIEKRYLRRDGSYFWANTTVSLVRNADGTPKHTLAVVQDISDRKQAEIALRESQARLKQIATYLPGVIYTYVKYPDGSDAFTYMSPGSIDLFELDSDAIMKDAGLVWAAVYPEDIASIQQSIAVSAEELTDWLWEGRILTSSDQLKWIQGSSHPRKQEDGTIIWDGLLMDISSPKQANEKLLHYALHDSLTDLPNRNLLMERIEIALNRARRVEDYRFAVLFIDLDRFKVINDSLGHLVGDQLLITIAQKLKLIIRTTDLAARLGGDEFVILLEEFKEVKETIGIAERILAELNSPLELEGRELFVTASIGIVLGKANYSQASELIRDADTAMYRAKSKGKCRYEIFDQQMHTQAMKRLHLENDLCKAIEGQELRVHYQPIFALNTGQIKGFEALVRWQNPSQGLISPAEFIAVAEETGLIVSLDRWVLQEACRQMAVWQAQFSHLPSLEISVNLSPQDLRAPGLIEYIEHTLTEIGLDGCCLKLEITEGMLVEDISNTIELLSQLKIRGIQISIDDFGTGYSSLSYLHRLPVDTLKIDRAFVSQMQETSKNYKIAETIIALSNQLGLATIAEGIETQQQIHWLQKHGCEFGQGYLLSKPLAPEIAEKLIGSHQGN